MDDEGESTAPTRPIRLEHARDHTGGHDHVQQVVVGQFHRVGGGKHHGFEDGFVDGHVEGLRDVVQDDRHTARLEIRQSFVGDGRRDQRLAGEFLETERVQFVECRDQHIRVAHRTRQKSVIQEIARAGERFHDHAREHSGRPTGDAGEPVERRGDRVEQRSDPIAQQWVGEGQVARVFVEYFRGAVVVHSPEDHHAGVGEQTGQVSLCVTDGPLLQHVAQ